MRKPQVGDICIWKDEDDWFFILYEKEESWIIFTRYEKERIQDFPKEQLECDIKEKYWILYENKNR